MGKVIGIDLGTTNSCVTIMENGQITVIPNSEGSRITPSVVAFTESGDRLVGQFAKRQAVTNPENTIWAVKRLMGKRFDDANVQHLGKTASFNIVKADNGDAWVRIRGKDYSPPEISAMILKKMKKMAADYLGEDVADAVITVPAHFDDTQRQATKDAGVIAGLNVLRIINEPTASAMAYGLKSKARQRVAVYDLGGGTFDISILELSEGVFEVRAVGGDTFLGGDDFDQRIVTYIVDEFMKSNGIDLRKDKMALQRLKEAAEKAKHELSTLAETTINLPFIGADAKGPKHLNMKFSRAMFEGLTLDLIERSIPICERVLKDAHLTFKDIDEAILVGGMTRMPKVQQAVSSLFGKEANRSVHPDEAVAIGAGIQASVLAGECKEVLLLDVIPLSLGVETQGNVFTKIIERNTTIPTRKSEVFSTAQDNQPLVSVHVLQGEREMAKDNLSLARFDLLGIPPAPRGVPKIEVRFDVDANAIVHVSAHDLGTGKEKSVKVTPTSGLNEDQIQQMLQDATAHEKEDREKRRHADAHNRLDALVYTTDKALQEYGKRLHESDLSEINSHLERARKLIDSGSVEELSLCFEELQASAYKITEIVYAKASTPDAGSAAIGEAQEDKKEEPPADA